MPKEDAITSLPSSALGGQSRPSSVGPLILWLMIQLAALLLAAMKTRYVVNFPKPEERLALEEILAAQIAAAAMLFPILLRDLRTTVILIIASWPFTALAGMMSAQIDPWKIACPAALVSAWLAGLMLWRFILRTPRARLAGVAVGITLALGGPLLWYLRADFHGGASEPSWNHDARLGPVMAALGLCDGGPRNAASWQFLAIFLAITVAFAAVTFVIARPQRSLRANLPRH